MNGTKFGAVSSIQQTVTRNLKAILEETFSVSFDSLYERCKRCAEAGGAMLSDGINKYLNVLCAFMASVRELNCHNMYR
jgi:hypothetical protein